MAESRAKERWAHTSSVMALIAETNRNPKKRGRPFTPDDFNPFARKRKRKKGTKLSPLNINALQVFLSPEQRRQLKEEEGRR